MYQNTFSLYRKNLKWLNTVEFFTHEITDIGFDLNFDMKVIENENVCEAHYCCNTLNAFYEIVHHFEQDSNCWNIDRPLWKRVSMVSAFGFALQLQKSKK